MKKKTRVNKKRVVVFLGLPLLLILAIIVISNIGKNVPYKKILVGDLYESSKSEIALAENELDGLIGKEKAVEIANGKFAVYGNSENLFNEKSIIKYYINDSYPRKEVFVGNDKGQEVVLDAVSGGLISFRNFAEFKETTMSEEEVKLKAMEMFAKIREHEGLEDYEVGYLYPFDEQLWGVDFIKRIR